MTISRKSLRAYQFHTLHQILGYLLNKMSAQFFLSNSLDGFDAV